MHRHRLERLARLSTGAALLGASALSGCNNDPKTINAPDPQPHINAPPEPTPSATTDPSGTASATPSATTSRPPTINAPARVNPPSK